MTETLATPSDSLLSDAPISPSRELGAYEALWANRRATFKSIAECFRSNPGSRPSDLVEDHAIESALTQVRERVDRSSLQEFGVQLNGSVEYPTSLRDAAYPVELLYYRGFWDLVYAPKRIAIVGSRDVSDLGIRRTRRLVRLLVDAGYTIVSGLAKGVDTTAHRTAIAAGGRTIAVIGTAITDVYPAENVELQEQIATEHLLISQVPIWRYGLQDYRMNRLFFPERNVTMSALSHGTVIVEASDTSGTLVQARAALAQGRKLFILDSCFQDSLKWPWRFLEQGAVRVSSIEDVRAAIE